MLARGDSIAPQGESVPDLACSLCTTRSHLERNDRIDGMK
jgi:hypothetical protein